MKTTWKYAAALAAIVIIALGGCSSDDSVRSISADAPLGDTGVDQGAVDRESAAESAPGDAQKAGQKADGRSGPDHTAAERAVISTGTVSLRSRDVTKARFEVQKKIDTLAGSIGDEQTSTNREGEVNTSRMVVRLPQKNFDQAMTELTGIAELSRTTRISEDVTTEVIDNEVRIRAQEKSLQRIEVLLAQATDISEIVRIESELTNRQSALDSLQAQQAWLADQTSLATITVHIEHTSAPVEDADEKQHTAFIAGLLNGWNALSTFTGVLAGGTGALLPFVTAALLLALPARLLWRRFRRAGRPARTPSTA